MNSNAIGKLAIFVLGMLLALRITLGIFGGSGNSLGNLYFYLAIGSLAAGIFAPRSAFMLLVIFTGYLDYFKRLLVVAGNVSFVDLYYVLGIAPLTLLGIMIGIVLNILNGRMKIRRVDVMLLVLSVVLFGVSAAFSLIGGGGGVGGQLGTLANESAYICLIFVVPVMFRSAEELRKLFKFIVIVFIPVALYTFYQSYNGITDWEREYLLSGFSLEARQLDERIFRPFSTMNAAGNVSMMMCLLAVVALFPLRKGLGGTGRWSPFGIIIAATFIYAAYLTFSRGPWVGGIAALVAAVLLSRPYLTIPAYVASVVGFVVIFLSAGYLLEDNKMAKWTDAMMSRTASVEQGMALRLGTVNSRLLSLQRTAETPERWTPFGIFVKGVDFDQLSGDHGSKYYVHDGFSDTLMRFGYIPMAILLFILVRMMLKVHRFQFSLPPKSMERRLVTLSLALVFGVGISFMGNSAQIRTYPVNFYFYLFISTPVALALAVRDQKEREKAKGVEATTKRAEPTAGFAPGGRGFANAGQ